MNKFRSKKQIVELCRENRKNMTPAESILWDLLRNRQLDNKKFLRQHKIIYSYSEKCYHFFVADYYCAEERLIVEVDGGIHDLQKEYDEWRTFVLNELKLRVLRIRNEEMEDIGVALEKIRGMFLASLNNNSPPAPLFSEERGDDEL
jgi:very-short-patch-repair endonuclease